MEKNLYIDASHPNETRVVLKSNNNIEDYEYEGSKNNLIKNNIYLGKVSRIEPSLQAAFVDFGRERHGFLSFNDIQSDYYQIPKSDLEIIKKEEKKLREELSKKVEEKEEENLAKGNLEIDDPIEIEKKENLDKNICFGFQRHILENMHHIALECKSKSQEVWAKRLDHTDQNNSIFQKLCDKFDKLPMSVQKFPYLTAATELYIEEERPVNKGTIMGYVDNYMLSKGYMTMQEYWSV